MKKLTKDEVNEMLGKYGFIESADREFIDKVDYLCGVDVFDATGVLLGVSNSIYFMNRPKGLEISLGDGFSMVRIAFLFEQINSIIMETRAQINGNRSASIVGQAHQTGKLKGPVADMIGNMIGIAESRIQAVEHPENILTISVKDENQSDNTILFSFKDKHTEKIRKYFTTYFREFVKEGPHCDPPIKDGSSQNQQVSVADELLKLKQLLDAGLLTHEEFDIQKKRLLK
jgi:hypothetical protein